MVLLLCLLDAILDLIEVDGRVLLELHSVFCLLPDTVLSLDLRELTQQGVDGDLELTFLLHFRIVGWYIEQEAAACIRNFVDVFAHIYYNFIALLRVYLLLKSSDVN